MIGSGSCYPVRQNCALHEEERSGSEQDLLEVGRGEDGKGEEEDGAAAGTTQMEAEQGDSATQLDGGLWGSLPEDLQDRILAWLPFPAFARACTVCKRWNSVMYSHSFLEMYRRVPSPEPCFLMFEAKDRSMCSVYNPASNRWHRIPFTFFHYETKFPCAAAGGLLCFCGVSAYPSLSVCNPVTRRWRELPPMLHKRFPNLVGMVVDPQTRAYKIVVAGDYYEDNVRTEVYDSTSNTWRITGNHLPIANYTLRNAFCNGFHFWVTRDPYGVIAFNMQHGVWSVVRAPMPSFLTSPHLVGCQRRLLMVGGLKKHAIPKNIRIWELEQSTMNWVEIVRMPHTLCKRFLKDSRNGDFMCVGHNDLICLTSYKCPHALIYDFSKRSWRWVPSCPLLTDIEDYRSTIGFPFNPRLDAPV
ncbi:F-box/kelch-repeat protein At5g15710 isoform X2 [Physcomitrium patens]|uniref:F-box/kelch-repeat protein At5g15710 isoform X2 n=1 Tax=Physcomitrium patens TaxID=3218 RepID=UPI000D17C43F|nr:F-box/kelch-repeat protein At5g15710-like [Physcomitrium patens]|eukprot:XP_024389333.1 F-box/kelch-repeat protein At5g15710-like [Physcomitrella patens]